MNIESILTPGVVTLVLLVLMYFLNNLGKNFLSKEDLARLEVISKMAVYAAEQLTKIQALSSDERKNYAFDLIKAELARYNIKLSDSVINAAIESSVYALNVTLKNKN